MGCYQSVVINKEKNKIRPTLFTWILRKKYFSSLKILSNVTYKTFSPSLSYDILRHGTGLHIINANVSQCCFQLCKGMSPSYDVITWDIESFVKAFKPVIRQWKSLKELKRVYHTDHTPIPLEGRADGHLTEALIAQTHLSVHWNELRPQDRETGTDPLCHCAANLESILCKILSLFIFYIA